MLGLGQQVGGNPGGIGAVVGDDDRFGWTIQAVNADEAIDLALGQGREQIAGADDFVHARNALGAEGQRGHGQRAADGEDCVDPGDGGGGEDDIGNTAVGLARRGGDDDLRHAGHLRRDGGHEQRRRQRRRATGHVDAGAGHGVKRWPSVPPMACRGPVGDRLQRVELADAFRGQFQSRDKIEQGCAPGRPAVARDHA